MANRIRGITIELGGDSTGLDKALKSVNNTIKSTQAQLKDVDRLLKMDPKNTELLAQKQKLLSQEIGATKEKLDTLKTAAKQANDQLAKGQMSQEQYDALQREIVETEQKLKGLDKELKETSNSWVNWEKVSEKAGKVAKAAAAAAAAAMAAAGAAAAKIAKDAVAAYSEYEQLSGGVEKIFDEANIDQIMSDAQNAYKTLNMSANQYLSAINKTGAAFAQTMGDQKGYEAAKTGMQAIADYASGTGRNIEELNEKFSLITRSTSSYQSIADQFSGLLPATSKDFLAQAQAAGLLGDSYKSLTDVPIAEYQEAVSQMLQKGVEDAGLAGNTVKESTETISGSLNMLKASWQNVLVSLVSGNGDLETSINALVESVQAVIKNLLPALKSAFKGIAVAVKELAPVIIAELPGLIDEVLPPLLDAVMEMAVALAETAPELVLTIVNAIVNNLPKLVDTAVKIIQALINGLIPAIPKLIPVALQAVNAIVNGLISNMPLLIRAAGQLIGGLVKGIIQNLPQIASAAWDIIKQIGDLFKPSTAIEWGKDMIAGLVQGLTDNLSLSSIAKGASKVAGKIASYLHFTAPDEGPLADYMTWMPDFIQGLTNSLVASEYRLTDAVSGLASDMANEMTANPNAGINSSLASIQGLLSRGNVIVLDTGELVGATAKAYNAEFGKIARLEAAT